MRNIITYAFQDKHGAKCESVELLEYGYPADLDTISRIHPDYKKIEILESRVMKY